MDEELTQSLIIRNRRRSRYSLGRSPSQQENVKHSIRVQEPIHEDPRSTSISRTSSVLEWEKSEELQVVPQQSSRTVISLPQPDNRGKEQKARSRFSKWQANSLSNERTLNDKIFTLKSSVQRRLYYVNYALNILMRLLFVGLLVFLVLENKWIYLQIFLSLEIVAVVMYVIVMIKMLFTRSDRESVYFSKIFNEAEWADIASQRLMRTHFNWEKVKSKMIIFFDPRTKFGKNVKISFLRQQIFKRMQLVMVYFPFVVMFFLHQDDFVTEHYPNFKLYITIGICLEILRTTFTYLVLYIYN